MGGRGRGSRVISAASCLHRSMESSISSRPNTPIRVAWTLQTRPRSSHLSSLDREEERETSCRERKAQSFKVGAPSSLSLHWPEERVVVVAVGGDEEKQKYVREIYCRFHGRLASSSSSSCMRAWRRGRREAVEQELRRRRRHWSRRGRRPKGGLAARARRPAEPEEGEEEEEDLLSRQGGGKA